MTKYDIPMPLLYDASLLPSRKLYPISAAVTLSLKPLSTANITVARDENIQIHDWIELFTPHGSAGIFRVSQLDNTVNENEVLLTLEHGICVLRDAIAEITQTAKRYTATDIRASTTVSYTGTRAQVTAACKAYQDANPGYNPNWAITAEDNNTYFEGTPENVLQQILSYQTIKVNGVNLWQKGTVTPTATVKFEVSHETCLDLLESLMEELQGYMLTFDMSSIPWSVSIVAKPNTVSSEGRLSRNLTNAQISYDDSELYTRVYMDGLPNGYLDADTVSTYGIIGTYIKEGNKLSATRKQQICQRYLNRHKNPAISVRLDGLELQQITGDDLDCVDIGRKYRLALPDYNTTVTEQVVTLYYPDVYGQPGSCNITLANDTQVLIGALSEMKKSLGGRGGVGSKKKEDETEEDADILKTKYELKVEQDNKHFSILATESEWTAAWNDYTVTHKSFFNQTARQFNLIATEQEYADLEQGDTTLVKRFDGEMEMTAQYFSLIFTERERQDLIDGKKSLVTNMKSSFTQTAGQITTLVEKTGVNSLGANENLYSKISQSADRITTLVSKTGINNLPSGKTLYSQIDQTATAIESKVSNGSVISAINQSAETITIQASKVNLVGYVTASELDVEKGKFDNLTSGITTATALKASMLQCTTFNVNGTVYRPTPIKLGSLVSFTSLTTSQAAVELNHSHSISSSINSSGVVTITLGGAQTTSSSSRTTNFNIADTTYFINAVSAAQNTGYKNAANAMRFPTGVTTGKEQQMYITYPNTSIGTSKKAYFLVIPSAWSSGEKTISVRQNSTGGTTIMKGTVKLPDSGTWDVHTDMYNQLGITVYANFTICGKQYSTSVVI